MDTMDTIDIKYTITFQDGSKTAFLLNIDPDSVLLKNGNIRNFPAWTRLDFHQCPGCPLSIEQKPYCPVALNLVELVSEFARFFSYDQIHVEVDTPERKIIKETTAQEGISSLMGLYIATSDCPMTDFFKPMARFHLPFANEEETIWRAVSAYLIADCLFKKENTTPENKFTGLINVYNDIQELNRAIVKRLRAASKKDSTLNALVLLDLFAKSVPPFINDSLEEFRHLFIPFFGKAA